MLDSFQEWHKIATPITQLEINMNIKNKVKQWLTYAPNLSDYIDETDLLANATLYILNDSEDDKIGRIRDLYDARIDDFADFVADNYDTNKHAQWVYEEVKDLPV